MKKILLMGLVLLSLMSCSNSTQKEETDNDVFICTGISSKRYHSTPDCKGLRRCSAEVEAISKEEAETEGKTPCKICY